MQSDNMGSQDMGNCVLNAKKKKNHLTNIPGHIKLYTKLFYGTQTFIVFDKKFQQEFET